MAQKKLGEEGLRGSQHIAKVDRHGQIEREHVMLILVEYQEGTIGNLIAIFGIDHSVVRAKLATKLEERPTAFDHGRYPSPRMTRCRLCIARRYRKQAKDHAIQRGRQVS